MKLPEMRPRQPLVAVALSAGLGVALADHWEHSHWWPLSIVIVLGVTVAIRPRTLLLCAFIAASFFSLHTLRCREGQPRLMSRKFASGPRAVKLIGIVSDTPQVPEKFSRFATCRFPVKLESIECGGQIVSASATVRASWNGRVPEYGDRVSMTGSAENLPPPRNPGEFDFAGYQRRHGIFTEVRARYASDCQILASHCGNPIRAFALTSQKWIRKQLELDLADSPDVYPVMEGMLLGLHNEAPEDFRDLLQRTGAVHLFAVSGLTVVMMAGLAWGILKPLRVSRRSAVLLIIPFLASYALVTGLSASCVRATIMCSVVLAGYLFDRSPSRYNSLSAAALLILGCDTDQLFSPGFQFSFAVVFVVIWLTTRVEKLLIPLGRPDPFLPESLWRWHQSARSVSWGWAARAVSVSLASWLGSLVFTTGYFHLFSPNAIIANVFLVPVAFLVLALGVGSVLSSCFSQTIAVLFNNANWLCAKLLLTLLKFFADFPGGSFYVASPMEYRAGRYEVTILDVGGGGAAHIRADGRDWLIDCGHQYDYNRCVLPYLRSRGVNSLDGLALTHGDTQHIGGALSAFHDFAPAILLESPCKDRSRTRAQIHAALEEQDFGKRIVWTGDCVDLSRRARLRVLYPPPGIAKSTAADKALVLLLETEDGRVLLSSDSGFATEEWLIQNTPDIRADVLVKGQHKKDISGTPDFLLRVAPKAVVCSAPEQGSLDEWAGMLHEKGIALFRQDATGAVTIQMDSSGIRVDGFLNNQSFRSRAE